MRDEQIPLRAIFWLAIHHPREVLWLWLWFVVTSIVWGYFALMLYGLVPNRI